MAHGLFIHDDALKTAAGQPISGVLTSAHLSAKQLAGGTNEFIWLRLSRVNYYLQLEPGSTVLTVTSEVGSKMAPVDTMHYEPQVVLDSDCRHDIRLTNKMFGVRLTTNELVSLSDFSLFGESAGTRA